MYSHLGSQQYGTAFSVESNLSVETQKEIWFPLQCLLQEIAGGITQMFRHQVRAVASTFLFRPALAQHWKEEASLSGEILMISINSLVTKREALLIKMKSEWIWVLKWIWVLCIPSLEICYLVWCLISTNLNFQLLNFRLICFVMILIDCSAAVDNQHLSIFCFNSYILTTWSSSCCFLHAHIYFGIFFVCVCSLQKPANPSSDFG